MLSLGGESQNERYTETFSHGAKELVREMRKQKRGRNDGPATQVGVGWVMSRPSRERRRRERFGAGCDRASVSRVDVCGDAVVTLRRSTPGGVREQ